MNNFDAIETAYQNEAAASRMLRDRLGERETPPVSTVEQIAATRRGSCTWDHYQVISWKDGAHFMTAVGVVVEASHLTLTEAWMYCDHLEAQGVLAALNPGI